MKKLYKLFQIKWGEITESYNRCLRFSGAILKHQLGRRMYE